MTDIQDQILILLVAILVLQPNIILLKFLLQLLAHKVFLREMLMVVMVQMVVAVDMDQH